MSDQPKNPLEELASVASTRLDYANVKRTKNRQRIANYATNVGRRSFIMQVVLLIWTIFYLLWFGYDLMTTMVFQRNLNASLPPGMPPPFSLPDLMLSASVVWGWFYGWAILAVPMVIASIAMLDRKKP